MLPDRQEHNQAYEYVRTIISATCPDGVPVVFGLRRVPKAVDCFTQYLQYLVGDINAMPHTGELKRAVREAFGAERNRHIGDGTVPLLEEALSGSQGNTILREIDKLKNKVPASSSDYWNKILPKWHDLFVRYDHNNKEEAEGDIFEDDNSSYEWEDDFSTEAANVSEEMAGDYRNGDLRSRIKDSLAFILQMSAGVILGCVLIFWGRMVKDRYDNGKWDSFGEAFDKYFQRDESSKSSDESVEQPKTVAKIEEERINHITLSCCYCAGRIIVELKGMPSGFHLECPYCHRSGYYSRFQ